LVEEIMTSLSGREGFPFFALASHPTSDLSANLPFPPSLLTPLWMKNPRQPALVLKREIFKLNLFFNPLLLPLFWLSLHFFLLFF